MANLKDLYTGTFIVIFLIVLAIYAYYYYKEEEEAIFVEVENSKRKEVAIHDIYGHFKKHTEKPKSTTFVHMMKNCILGISRGFLMGLLLGGFEGAVTTAIVLGIINSAMTPIEYHW